MKTGNVIFTPHTHGRVQVEDRFLGQMVIMTTKQVAALVGFVHGEEFAAFQAKPPPSNSPKAIFQIDDDGSLSACHPCGCKAVVFEKSAVRRLRQFLKDNE